MTIQLTPTKKLYIGWTLFAIQIPLLFAYYRQLLTLEHYQFYPMALLCFGLLLFQRRHEYSWKWNRSSSFCLVLNLILLVSAFFLHSPWLGALAALFFSLVVCLALRDEEKGDSPAYLTLLLLMTLRLPLGLDLEAIHWLQRLTTAIASKVLSFFQYLHVREGNVLEFVGKRFLIEEACSGVQSLFAVMFVATLIICVSRRPWLRSIIILGSAFCFAGVMNVARVCAISIGWQSYQVDLSTGWQHDAIGYVALALAATLVFSTDTLLGLIFAPIPDGLSTSDDPTSDNPITTLWNRLCGERSSQSRRANRPRDFFRPQKIFSWAWGFVQKWVRSRDWKLMPLAVIFVVIGGGATGFLLWLETTPQQEVVVALEKALSEAATAGDDDAKSVYLKALMSERPHELLYRFQLAIHLLENDQKEAAAEHLMALTQPGLRDFAPARLWLAGQALSKEPSFPLSDDQIEGHLLMAMKVRSEDPQLRVMLADVYIRKGQLNAAENHLQSVVIKNPAVALSLARISKQLDRSDETIKQHLSAAFAYFEEILESNPTSVPHRVQFAEALVLGGRVSDAERILKEGLVDNSDSVELRTALAGFYQGLAATRLKESLLNRDQCAKMLVEAIRLTPANRAILQQALTLNSFGAAFTLEDLKPAIDAIVPSDESTIEERILRIRALAAVSQIDIAILELQPLSESAPELNIVKARLLKAVGRSEESEALIQRLLQQMAVTASEDSLKAVLEYVDVLSLASRFEEALTLMHDVKAQKSIAVEEQQQFDLLLGQTSIALYDKKLSSGTFATADEALQALENAWETKAVSLSVLKRLAALSCSETSFSTAADQTLDGLLASSSATADVYSMVGTMALNQSQNTKARRYLERALRLDRTNPMIKNNLALALVRDSDSDPDRAMELVNQTLTILPENPDVLSTRAEIYIAQKRWEDARRDLEVSYQKSPQSVDCCRLLARVCDEMGEASLAEQYRNHLAQMQNKVR